MSYTKPIDKQASNVEYTGSWSGLAGGNEVQLESASSVSNGFGTFGGKPLADNAGTGAINLRSGIDFTYDQRLDTTSGGVDIYDNGVSGALSSGKKFRILENSKNITDDTGLNLNVRAKALGSTLLNPPSTEVYVDPISGKFVLPRPIYWNKMESLSLATNHEIAQYTPSFTTTGEDVVISGKFNNCIRCGSLSSTSTRKTGKLKPIGETVLPNSGTASYWIKIQDTDNNGYPFVSLNEYNTNAPFRVICSHEGSTIRNRIYINDTIIVTDTITEWKSNFKHVYIIWDKDGGLSSSKSIRVFANGTEILSTTQTFTIPSSSRLMLEWGIPISSGAATAFLDNLKIWNHVVSEDPSFEYNSGTGREDALHSIYGATNGYKPSLVSGTSSGVGYYKSGSAGSNVIITI